MKEKVGARPGHGLLEEPPEEDKDKQKSPALKIYFNEFNVAPV